MNCNWNINFTIMINLYLKIIESFNFEYLNEKISFFKTNCINNDLNNYLKLIIDIKPQLSIFKKKIKRIDCKIQIYVSNRINSVHWEWHEHENMNVKNGDTGVPINSRYISTIWRSFGTWNHDKNYNVSHVNQSNTRWNKDKSTRLSFRFDELRIFILR